jgi:hypothetical protein
MKASIHVLRLARTITLTIPYSSGTKFHDVDEADLALDEMNLGQSHRLRMTAELSGSLRGTSTSTRGGHMQRVGRGGSSNRGRDNLNISRFAHSLNCLTHQYRSPIC